MFRRLLLTLPLLTAPVAVFAQSPAASSAHPPVEVAGDHLEQTARCTDNAPMTILANDSRLSILGNCTVVTITGSGNWMTVQHARRIITAGNRNTVLYDDRSTRVEDRGKANSVTERWPQ